MLQVHLVRHGQTNFNAERRVQGQHESVLDETGRNQAEQLRATVESLKLTAVYSSSNVRARQTTEILTTNLSLEVNHMDGLREIYMGPWERRLWDDVKQSEGEHYDHFMTRPHLFSVAGTESFHDLQQRGIDAVESVIAAEKTGSVLVVSHGAILKATLAHYAGVELSRMWEHPLLDNCSRSVLHATNGKREVLSVGGVQLSETAWRA